ncbi:MAG: Hint domain-containing protein [Planktotalea sp.]|uniref:Hint domain-containing protein n=1 Tax=Planktotalea sp. TaxID=2029877 RepID=UPI003C72D6A5
MPTYTVEAFRWTGTGYNSVYNTSYTAVLTDNDPNYQGSGDGGETVSINGGAAGSTTSAPYAINVSFTPLGGGASQVETFYFFYTTASPAGWYFVPAPGSAFTVGATLGGYQSHTTGWTYSSIVCFGEGTLIETDQGLRAVETLEPGARIALADGGFAPLRLNLLSPVSADQMASHDNLRPVRICGGALGNGLPKRDLLVSRQHRMQVSSAIAARMFGNQNVLIAAIRLTDLPGIYVDDSLESLNYYHLVFDRHNVVFAEGAPAESFYTGREAIAALNPDARGEVLTLFPQLARKARKMKPARLIPERVQQKQLIARHMRNEKPLLSAMTAQEAVV